VRLIPVMDLRDGLAVHAVRGEREQYRPVAGVLAATADPLDVARAFHEKLGLSELYIADLNAIQGHGHHQALISRLAQQSGMSLIVDAGAASVASAVQLLDAGASRVIIGAETLPTWETALAIGAAIDPRHLIFSLDMRAGQVLSRCSQLAASTPAEVLDLLYRANWREVILLDLSRVGTGTGVDQALVAEARRLFPQLMLLAGGGVRDANELAGLRSAGVAGVLVATALHQGLITRQHVAALMSGGIDRA
jgi:phosphoribosylformimino-5-aminoimidazole carboxamide ribotide isomerase